MELWAALRTKGLTPTRLWLKLDPETRMEAAQSLYDHDWEGDPVPMEADANIAAALKFRPVAIKKLPKAERVKYLAKVVRPERSLVSSLLLGLHLHKRADVMATFLDALKIPHESGLIDEDYEFETFEAEALEAPIETLVKAHDEKVVDLYLVTIFMMDPNTWKNLPKAMETKFGITGDGEGEVAVEETEA